MIAREVMRDYIQRQPFRPFQVRLASGRTYDVRHPEMVRLGSSWLLVFHYVGDAPDFPDYWDTVSLMLIDSVTFLDVPVA